MWAWCTTFLEHSVHVAIIVEGVHLYSALCPGFRVLIIINQQFVDSAPNAAWHYMAAAAVYRSSRGSVRSCCCCCCCSRVAGSLVPSTCRECVRAAAVSIDAQEQWPQPDYSPRALTFSALLYAGWQPDCDIASSTSLTDSSFDWPHADAAYSANDLCYRSVTLLSPHDLSWLRWL